MTPHERHPVATHVDPLTTLPRRAPSGVRGIDPRLLGATDPPMAPKKAAKKATKPKAVKKATKAKKTTKKAKKASPKK